MFTAFSAPVTKEEAISLGTNFLKYYSSDQKSNFDIISVVEEKNNNLTTFYIINYAEGGFIIVSADDRVEPILGYSEKSFIPENITNASFKSWLNSYSEQIEYAVKEDIKSTDYAKKWSDLRNSVFYKGTTAVTPFITTSWDQEGYYNDLCPTRTPTGCVATAMAQIMNYYEYPLNGYSSNTYTHPVYGVLSADFSDVYDWASMPNSVTSANSAVAELMSECGVSVNMDYNPSGSGAMSEEVVAVLANYFKYDPTTIQFLDIADFTNIQDFKDLIIADLDELSPVYYAGSGDAGGHAFVCCGYDATEKLYFNFGWSGFGNGYFEPAAITPSGSDFSENNRAIIGIQPGEEDQPFMWVSKSADFIYNAAYPGYICALDNNIAWSINRDGSGGDANYKMFSRTIDGGLTWTSDEFTTYGTSYAMVEAINAFTAYIPVWGTGTNGNRLIKTTDGGETWTSILQGAGSGSFFNVVQFFDENNGYLMGDPEGGEYEIYVTSDAGANWTRVAGTNIPNPVSGEFGITGMCETVGNTTWFTTNRGRIYKSNDMGLTWEVFTIAALTTDTNIEIAFDDSGLAGVADYYSTASELHTLYITADGGETWTLTTPTGNWYESGTSSVPGSLNTFVSVGADATTPNMGISYSTDGGLTWTDYASFYSNGQVISIDMVSIDKGFAGTFGQQQDESSAIISGGFWVLGDVENQVANAAEITGEISIAQSTTSTYTTDVVENVASYEWTIPAGITGSSTCNYIDLTFNQIGAATISVTPKNYFSEGESSTLDLDVYTFINENNELVTLSTYPNPATDFVNLSCKNAIETIEVYNVNGQLISSLIVNNQNYKLNVKDFEDGMYILNIKIGNNTITQNIIVK